MSDALAGMLQRRDQMLLATLGIALLAVGVCWWAIARSLAPMNHAIATLSAQARSQLPGYVQLPTARRDEVGALIAGFNAVLRALEQREQDLLQSRQQQEQQRLRQEAAHRVALVREVHHRIKNNLQGILALMRQHAHRHPELREPLYQAIGQVQSISTLHGLQGRSAQAVVLLCNLVDAIAVEVGVLWACEIAVHRPQPWQAYRLAEQEAVPIALVLYELMLNAVKHGNPAVAPVSVRLSPHAPEAGVEVTICNAGDWAPNQQSQGSGMGLMQALMPRQGARLVHSHEPGQVCVRLHLWAPVVTPHTQDDRAADKEV
jgi:two-component sensor histidine kinase